MVGLTLFLLAVAAEWIVASRAKFVGHSPSLRAALLAVLVANVFLDSIWFKCNVVLVFDPELELPALSFGQLCFWLEGAFVVAVAFGVGLFVWAEAWDRPVTPA